MVPQKALFERFSQRDFSENVAPDPEAYEMAITGPNSEALSEAKGRANLRARRLRQPVKRESYGLQQALFSSRFDRAAARLVRALQARRRCCSWPTQTRGAL